MRNQGQFFFSILFLQQSVTSSDAAPCNTQSLKVRSTWSVKDVRKRTWQLRSWGHSHGIGRSDSTHKSSQVTPTSFARGGKSKKPQGPHDEGTSQRAQVTSPGPYSVERKNVVITGRKGPAVLSKERRNQPSGPAVFTRPKSNHIEFTGKKTSAILAQKIPPHIKT